MALEGAYSGGTYKKCPAPLRRASKNGAPSYVPGGPFSIPMALIPSDVLWDGQAVEHVPAA